MDDHGVYDQSALLRTALRRAIADAAVVTAPTQFVLADLRRRFGLVDGGVVPNGIDLQPPARELVRLPVGRPVVLAVGRVERMKGFDLLLDAAADSRLEHVQFVIGGDGSQTLALREQAVQLGIDKRVHFLGQLTPGEVASAMAAADVVAVPSRNEAFGIVALEAWRSGTSLIGTVHGGMPEFVADGVDGLLVDPTDVDALAGGLKRILTEDGLARRLADAGRGRVPDFSWAAVAQRYRQLYAGLGEVRGG
ncbi:glycosyltransferase involved in cell wall biosynthesis [Janibacter cremeus]|uniref:D-inositol 3-phosphate glycosyltransferase n=2 Tax=Janibacter cremeus TaxID=1285192 RepID=A0A852VT10_9MICO|nr:glycosyltransferase involved in cell wall biosynthesis [Janibacter cremeus]